MDNETINNFKDLLITFDKEIKDFKNEIESLQTIIKNKQNDAIKVID